MALQIHGRYGAKSGYCQHYCWWLKGMLSVPMSMNCIKRHVIITYDLIVTDMLSVSMTWLLRAPVTWLLHACYLTVAALRVWHYFLHLTVAGWMTWCQAWCRSMKSSCPFSPAWTSWAMSTLPSLQLLRLHLHPHPLFRPAPIVQGCPPRTIYWVIIRGQTSSRDARVEMVPFKNHPSALAH